MKKKSLLLTAVAMLGLTAATIAQNVPNYLPTNGLIGWWPFSGNANDESGNGNNGTVSGAILTTDRFGNLNKAFYLDGLNNHIDFPNTASINNNEITASIWMNPVFNGSNATYYILHKSTDFGNTRFWALRMGATGALSLEVRINNTYYDLYAPLNTYNFNQWNLLVFTYDGINAKLYSNNVCVISLNAPGTLTSNSLPMIAGYFPDELIPPNGYFFNGKLDDIGIWNRALTQQEITDLYNGANCANNTTITPSTNTLNTGSTAIFSASTSDSNPSHVWQSDFGQGYVTLNNFGNYSGTNTATLNLSNVQLSNHNLPIRVITTSGNCIDTSNVAVISIADTCINTITDTTLITVTDTLLINTNLTGVNPPNNVNTIKLFPNPANDHITINYGNFSVMNGCQLKIENSIGQQVFQTNITQQSDYLNLTTWGGNGLYFVHIINPQGYTIDIRKIVLQ